MIEEKTWSKDLETPIIEDWVRSRKFSFNKSSGKPVYSIDTPPPYINAPIHIGQNTTYALMDMFARYRRMTGHEVIFPLGLDRNGIPIEIATEKRFNIKLTQIPRDEFIQKCKELLEEFGIATTNTFFKTGISFSNWEFGTNPGDAYMTDSDEYRALTQATFIDMWNKGLVYEAERINNYCPGCKTTIADSELEYKDVPSKFNDIKFKVKETGEEIAIGTTRPELICSCGMVIFNPDDQRYKHLDGKTAITPMFNREVPIKAHPQADMEKGTGLVMMCSAGDTSDIRFFREQNLKPVISIDIEGKMNENAGALGGLTVKEARKKILEMLQDTGLLVGSRQIDHRTPVCDRSGDDIEFIMMKEFYLKQVEFKNDIKKLMDQMNFVNPQSKQMLLDWLDAVSTDWPISRRRYYATEVPLWYCGECGKAYVPRPGKYYIPWRDDPPDGQCTCGSRKFYGDTRVLDTWFDSSISELYVLGYMKDQEFFFKNFPASLRPQGKDIVRTWLYYTILRGYLLTNRPAFKDVWVHHHIVDEKGYRMSKSKGNTVDPMEALEKFGAEAFRLWAASEGNLVYGDLKCSFDRIEGNAKTHVKLWNVCKFISQFQADEKPKRTALDDLILKEANELVKFCKEHYEQYDFHNPALKIKNFIWEILASHYLEIVKPRAYNEKQEFDKREQSGAIRTLNDCIDIILKVLHPINPIITEKLYKSMRGKDIHSERFPEHEEIKSSVPTQDFIDFNSTVWKMKKDSGKSLKEEIPDMVVPASLKPLEADIRAAHKIKTITYG